MNKATILADLYKRSVQEYTKSPSEWKGLLSCVARFYKRSFDNSVLIYAQKPNATQLGTWEEWHDERIGRSLREPGDGQNAGGQVRETCFLRKRNWRSSTQPACSRVRMTKPSVIRKNAGYGM